MLCKTYVARFEESGCVHNSAIWHILKSDCNIIGSTWLKETCGPGVKINQMILGPFGQWHSQLGAGAESPLTAKNLLKIRKKRKNLEKRKNWEKEEKSARKGKNQEGSFTFAPSNREGWLRHCKCTYGIKKYLGPQVYSRPGIYSPDHISDIMDRNEHFYWGPLPWNFVGPH